LNGAQKVYPTTYDILTLSGNNTETINGTTSTNILNLSGASSLIIGANSLTANTVNRNNPITVTISTGTFTVNGNLTLNVTDPITFSGAGNLNVTGNLSCGTLTGSTGTISVSGTFAPNSYVYNTSTVNFSGSGSQNIPVGAFSSPTANTYYNIITSGGGTKTLTGNNITISNVLTLNSGILEIGGNNLTLTNTASGAITTGTSYSSSNMIATDGSNGVGYVIRPSGTVMPAIFPVGSINTSNYYSPANFTAIGIAGALSVKAVYLLNTSNFLDNYWDIKKVNAGTATFTLTNDVGEVNSTLTTGFSVWETPTFLTNWQTPPPAGGTSSCFDHYWYNFNGFKHILDSRSANNLLFLSIGQLECPFYLDFRSEW
jgi:hypothetical protein